MTEAQIHKAVIDHWKATGKPNTLVATIPNMKAFGQYGLTRGLPDLLVIGPKGVAFIELKTETGRLSHFQREFVDLCDRNEIPCHVTYGRDEPIEVLKKLEVVK